MKNPFYLGTNLKMTKTAADTASYVKGVDALLEHFASEDLQCFIIPSYTAIPDASRLSPEHLLLGAQNMCWAESGEYTGEISPGMLEEFSIHLIEIGHSERRHVFGESDDMARLKVNTALAHGMTALVCVGETLEEKDAGKTQAVLRRQILTGLDTVNTGQLDRIWLAYEPVWAIGSAGKAAPPDYVHSVHSMIRGILLERFGDAGKQIPLLFGGSVNAGNAASYACVKDVDGLFVGRAVWTIEGFSEMLDVISEILPTRED